MRFYYRVYAHPSILHTIRQVDLVLIPENLKVKSDDLQVGQIESKRHNIILLLLRILSKTNLDNDGLIGITYFQFSILRI
ncbi:unnamed protein product [Adineta ricciae]|uniref:Uncharacterized protein n=1 Tax=Adineta ricciae TaxID=249248 RepID=A0A815V8H0_ADIRI|nr:unnamed protein product [Adineta ricciae]